MTVEENEEGEQMKNWTLKVDFIELGFAQHKHDTQMITK